MNNLLQKNIFLQQTKDKYNPDVISKKNIIEKDRKNNIFKKNEIVYNSITNISHINIKTHKDLELQKDKPLNNLTELLAEKNKERCEQEIITKLPKQKVIINNLNNEKIQTYSELKSEQINFTSLQENEIKQNKNKYENIIDNLKNLGILNN
jgi:hypothetical protein